MYMVNKGTFPSSSYLAWKWMNLSGMSGVGREGEEGEGEAGGKNS